MPNRTEARAAKAALTNATGRLPLLRLFSTPLKNQSSPGLRRYRGRSEIRSVHPLEDAHRPAGRSGACAPVKTVEISTSAAPIVILVTDCDRCCLLPLNTKPLTSLRGRALNPVTGAPAHAWCLRPCQLISATCWLHSLSDARSVDAEMMSRAPNVFSL